MRHRPDKETTAVVEFSAKDKRPRQGIVYVISGPSGAGKNTLINQLKGLDFGLHFVPSFSTRAMRTGERQGDPYYFVDVDEFKRMVDDGEFLEFEEIHGNYYGTHAKTYQYAIDHGYDAIKDIDVKGALNFRRRFDEHVVLIYVRPTSLNELAERLIQRGDAQMDIDRRLQRIQFEESQRAQFDYVIYNDDLESAKNELVSIIQSKT